MVSKRLHTRLRETSMPHLHHVACSSLRNSCSHSNSGLRLSAVVISVNFRRGVKMIGSMRKLRCCRIRLRRCWGYYWGC